MRFCKKDRSFCRVRVDITPVSGYAAVTGRKQLTQAVLSAGDPHAVSFLSPPIAGFASCVLYGVGELLSAGPM